MWKHWAGKGPKAATAREAGRALGQHSPEGGGDISGAAPLPGPRSLRVCVCSSPAFSGEHKTQVRVATSSRQGSNTLLIPYLNIAPRPPPTSGPVLIIAFHTPAPPMHYNTPELKRLKFSTNTRSWTRTQARWQPDIGPFSRKGADRVTSVLVKLRFVVQFLGPQGQKCKQCNFIFICFSKDVYEGGFAL